MELYFLLLIRVDLFQLEEHFNGNPMMKEMNMGKGSFHQFFNPMEIFNSNSSIRKSEKKRESSAVKR